MIDRLNTTNICHQKSPLKYRSGPFASTKVSQKCCPEISRPHLKCPIYQFHYLFCLKGGGCAYLRNYL